MMYSEVEQKLIEVIEKRGKGITVESKKQEFNELLKTMKEKYNRDISREFLRNLLISNGMDNRKATFKIANFARAFNIETTERTIRKPCRIIKSYANIDESGDEMPISWEFNNSIGGNVKTLNFFN